MTAPGGERDWPYDAADAIGESAVEFVLKYDGPLPACGSGGGKTRAQEKHAIRKQLHPQLAELWKTEPYLDFYENKFGLREVRMKGPVPEFVDSYGASAGEDYRNHYLLPLAGYHFVPLVTRTAELVCRLTVTFLRRGEPGELIRSGGDLDNRMKTLFDGLRMPHAENEVPEHGSGEERFYCLLEDDALISGITIDTHKLLRPPVAGAEDDVSLNIAVTVRALRPSFRNRAY